MTDINRKALYIAQECLKAGMTVAGAAGVLANVAAESAFNPRNLQDTYERALGYNDDSYTDAVDNGAYQGFTRDGAGYGLAQWTASDRKAKMMTYFKQRGKSIGDFELQVEYLIHDIRTFYNSKPWKTCISSNNPYDCGYAVCKYYETRKSGTDEMARIYPGISRQRPDRGTAEGTGTGQGRRRGAPDSTDMAAEDDRCTLFRLAGGMASAGDAQVYEL